MKRTWLIIAAWLMLLVPTVLGGIASLRLLRHEQERIAGEAAAAATARTRTAVENIALAVGEVRDGVLASLQGLPVDNLAAGLERWQRENPLIRNVFVWTPSAGVTLPDPQHAIGGEAAFLRRYDELFRRQTPWGEPQRDTVAVAVAPEPADESVLASLAGRRELRKLAQAPAAPDTASLRASGWLPWFSADQLGFLAWAETAPGGTRYGVEIETMALLSRLAGVLPVPNNGETYALLDGNGRVVFQRGAADLDATTVPVVSIPLTPTLPHWQVAVYPGLASFDAGRSFQLIASLVALACVSAILFGGSLLLWQAWRHLQDARRKTSFVANVSHELKTPLTTIRMYAELLEEGTIRDAEKRHRYLRVIVSESQRLGRLVGNLLDFSRLEQGRKQYTPENFDPAELTARLLDQQQERLAAAGLTVTRQLATGCRVRADRDAVAQALLNLLDNAVKYAASGQELAVQLQSAGNSVELSVADRGPGVPAAHRSRIFNTFHRVDDSLTSRQPGCGLGLNIARQLLRDQGGELRFEPNPVGGARFVIVLPCAAKEEA